MKLKRKLLLYIVFALVSLVFFFYFRFPSEMIKDALSAAIKQSQPNAEVEIGRISPAIPPGLKLETLFLNYAGYPLIRMDQLKITPSLISLFSGGKRYTYRGNIGSGHLNGHIVTAVEDGREHTQLYLTMNRVPLNHVELLNQLELYKPDGEVDATVKYDNLKGGGTVDVHMEISPARIAFDPPIMGMEALDFRQLIAQLVISQRMLQIRNCDAAGDQIDGKISGTIVFGRTVEQSRIMLSLTVKPQPAFIADHRNDMIGGLLATANAQKRGVVFRISGTIGNPRYVIR